MIELPLSTEDRQLLVNALSDWLKAYKRALDQGDCTPNELRVMENYARKAEALLQRIEDSIPWH